MRFTKMQGAGNDFIILNNMNGEYDYLDFSALAKQYCQRRISVGADGMMVVVPSEHADFRMIFYNSDGSLGEMCGNGARCIARYGYEYGLSGIVQKIEVTSGIVYGERITETDYRIKLNDPSVLDAHRAVTIGPRSFDCGYVELGNPGLPHGIVVLSKDDDFDKDRWRDIARSLRFAPEFPKGANISFVIPENASQVNAITFERGVEDYTLACGTGCGSIAAILYKRNLISAPNVEIHMPGGILQVSLSCNDDIISDIYLTGPTCIVCDCNIVA